MKMMLKYNLEFDRSAVEINLKRITNQIYKLLPAREEGEDWKKPLDTVIEELTGLKEIMLTFCQSNFLTLLSKLEGLYSYTEQEDFSIYRRTIFECLGIIGGIKDYVCTK